MKIQSPSHKITCHMTVRLMWWFITHAHTYSHSGRSSTDTGCSAWSPVWEDSWWPGNLRTSGHTPPRPASNHTATTKWTL